MTNLAKCTFQVGLSGSYCIILGRKVGFSPLGLIVKPSWRIVSMHCIITGIRATSLRAETVQCSLVEVW